MLLVGSIFPTHPEVPDVCLFGLIAVAQVYIRSFGALLGLI